MEVTTLEVSGIYSTLISLRLPFKLEARSTFDMFDEQIIVCERSDQQMSKSYHTSRPKFINIDSKDLALLRGLILKGDEHAKVVRGIIAYCSVVAPRYWWQEMDTYRVGTDRLSSESTMHVEAKGLSGEELQRVKGELKESHEQRRNQWFSYQTLRRIWKQRGSHRLPEWHIFIGWIKSLPLAEELVLI